jgi:copper chaperone
MGELLISRLNRVEWIKITIGEVGMKTQVINVDGMSCDHCVQTVTAALDGIKGVGKVQVDLEKKTVTVDFEEDQTGLEIISAKINSVGFEVVE